MNIFIREAVAGDADKITELSIQLGYVIDKIKTNQNLEIITAKNDEKIFVALFENQLAGWIHVFHTTRLESGSFCEIGGIVVDEQYKRKGIGKMLIEYIKPWCIKQGTASLRVRCNIKRTEAHQFYSDLGFIENKQQKVFEIAIE
jgi:GNAT superfamily N-acetyltransferase